MSGEFRYPANSLVNSDNFTQSGIINQISSNSFFPEALFLTGNLTGSGNISRPNLEKFQTLIPNELSGTGSLNQPTLNIINILSSNLTGNGNLVGNLTQKLYLNKDLNGFSDVVGALTKTIKFNRDLTGSSDIAGTLETSVYLQPNALIGRGLVNNAHLQITYNISGDFVGQGLLNNANLLTQINLNGNLLGQANVLADVTKVFELAGSIDGNGDVNGAITNEVLLVGNAIEGNSSLVGSLYKIIFLQKALDGFSDTTGDLLISYDLQGDLLGNSNLSNSNLNISYPFSGIFNGESNLYGSLNQTINLSKNLNGFSDLAGSISLGGNDRYLTGSISGTSSTKGELYNFKFAGLTDGIRKEKELGVSVSNNGDIVSGSIFSVVTLPKNTDGFNLIFVPLNNHSKGRIYKIPVDTFDIEVYVDDYLSNKLYAKATFDTSTEIATITPQSFYKNLESGEKLIFVCNKSFVTGFSYNDMTFAINLMFAVCK